MKKNLALLLSAFLMCTMFACAPSHSARGEDGAEKLTLVLDWTPNTNHTGFYVAQELGYFEQNGLSLDIVQPPEDGAGALVASGKAQFGVDFQDSLAPAFALDNPLPVTAVAAILQHNTSGIISLKEKGIESPKGLEGRTYATWDIPVEKAMIKRVVEKDGGDYAKINMVPTTVTDVISAISTNIDAVWIFYGWDGIACKVRGLDTNYFQFADIEPVFDYYTPVIVANNDFLETKPDAAKKFLEAAARGYAYAVENPGPAADILLKYAPELDAEMVRESQKWLADRYIADAPAWGVMDQGRWDAFYQFLYGEKLIEKEIPAGFGMSTEYLPQ